MLWFWCKKTSKKPITACSAGAETEPSRSSEAKELVYKAPNEAALRQNAFCAVKLTGLIQNNKVRKLSVGSVRSLWLFLAARQAQSGVTGNVPETQLRNVVNCLGVFPQAGLPRRRSEVCRSPANTWVMTNQLIFSNGTLVTSETMSRLPEP